MTQIGPIASILYDWSFFLYFVIYCSQCHMNKNVKLLCYQIFFQNFKPRVTAGL